MKYFIPWVIFLLVVILSVPVAAWLEKRKLQADSGLEEDEVASFDDAGEAGHDDVVTEEPAEPEPAFDQGVEFGAGGEDDFSAFEEIR
jgi:hypothetical protein